MQATVLVRLESLQYYNPGSFYVKDNGVFFYLHLAEGIHDTKKCTSETSIYLITPYDKSYIMLLSFNIFVIYGI